MPRVVPYAGAKVLCSLFIGILFLKKETINKKELQNFKILVFFAKSISLYDEIEVYTLYPQIKCDETELTLGHLWKRCNESLFRT